MIRCVPIAMCFLVVSFWPFADRNASGNDDHRAGRDVFCGARCVRYVLSHYGQEEDLLDVIKELQWPHLERPVSLNQLAEFLNQRGIKTHACHIGTGVDLIGQEPAILHLRPMHGRSGHFVVWLSECKGRARITDGLDVPSEISNRDLANLRSGYALLTSTSHVSDPGSRFVVHTYRSLFNWLPEVSGCGLAVVLFCFGYSAYERRVK